MSGSKLAKGAAILSLAGFLSKAIGALYRIPLFRMIGAEGMGLYQMAYPLYTLLLTVSSAGIPVAISKMVSERVAFRDHRGAGTVLFVGLIIMSITGGLGSVCLFFGAEPMARYILKDLRAYYSIVAIAPAIFFVGIMAAFRGYFQGYQNMVPTAFSQVIEQTARVVTVLIGAYLFLPKGIKFAAAAATAGAVAGALAGAAMLVLWFTCRRQVYFNWAGKMAHQKGQGIAPIVYKLAVLALPISLGGLVLPMVQILDAVTVPLRLQEAGYTVAKSAELYGELTGGAVTLVNVPTIFTLALATALVPVVSELKTRGNFRQLNKIIFVAMKAATSICLPAAAGLFILAAPISDLLFKCPEAGIPLAVLAPAAVFIGLHQVTAGILQGLGKTYLPVKNLGIGVLIKFALNYWLTGLPEVGIKGAAFGTVAGFCISALLNCYDLYRVTKWQNNWQVLSRPAVAVTIMATGVYFLYSFLKLSWDSSFATLASILAGALIYVSVLSIVDRGEDSFMRFAFELLGRRNGK